MQALTQKQQQLVVSYLMYILLILFRSLSNALKIGETSVTI